MAYLLLLELVSVIILNMPWLIPALLTCLSWGIGQVFIKKGLTNLSAFINDVFFVFFAILITVPYALIGGAKWNFFSDAFIFGILASSPNLIFPYVLEKTDVSLSGTVLATYPMFTIFLSITFLKETLNITQILGIIMIVVGTILVAKPKKTIFELRPWLIWAAFGSILVGFGDFIGKVGLSKYGLFSFLLAYSLCYLPSLLFIRLFDKSKLIIAGSKRNILISLIGNFLMPLGLIFLYIALNRGPASLVSPVTSTYPALTAILAFYFLKEKISRCQFLGIFSVTIGIILTSL